MRKQQELLQIIFPRARGTILRLLFTAPKKARYVNELAQRGHLALSTVQEELATLVASGLITAGVYRSGCKRFYRANRDHPLFPHLLGIVHGCGRMRAIDISDLRRARRPKWKGKPKLRPYYWRPSTDPTGRIFR